MFSPWVCTPCLPISGNRWIPCGLIIRRVLFWQPTSHPQAEEFGVHKHPPADNSAATFQAGLLGSLPEHDLQCGIVKLGVVLGDFGHRQPVVQILADCDEVEVLHTAYTPFPVALGVLRFGRGAFNQT